MAAAGASVLIGATLLVLALGVAALTFAARGRWRRSLRAAFTAGLLVTLYAVALVGVSATAPARSLATGEWKCFDDWCASVTSATRTGEIVQVDLAVRNQGRREQAPDTPQVWLVHDGRRDKVVLPALESRLPGRSSQHLRVRVVAPATEHPLLLVTEGGFPSALVIGDENSPLHPQPAWQLN